MGIRMQILPTDPGCSFGAVSSDFNEFPPHNFPENRLVIAKNTLLLGSA
jgi:hypothetical protein